MTSRPILQKPHPLPGTLEKWQDKTNGGDYFDQIQYTKVGYLIWSNFPVKVKIETRTGVSEKQAQLWVNSVVQAVQESNVYLPLQVVEEAEAADVKIFRKAPPLKVEPNSKIPHGRSALTIYDLYIKNNFYLTISEFCLVLVKLVIIMCFQQYVMNSGFRNLGS